MDKAFFVEKIEHVVENAVESVCETAADSYNLYISICPVENSFSDAFYNPQQSEQYDENGISNNDGYQYCGNQIYDANGTPLYDVAGNPIYGEQVYNELGMPEFDEAGNPVYNDCQNNSNFWEPTISTTIDENGDAVIQNDFASIDNELMATKAQIEETRESMKNFIGEKPPGFDDLFAAVEAYLADFQEQHDEALQAQSIDMARALLNAAYDLQTKLKNFYNAFIGSSGGEAGTGAAVSG